MRNESDPIDEEPATPEGAVPTRPLPGHQTEPVNEARVAAGNAVMAQHFTFSGGANRGRPTPADTISTRPLVPLSIIYQRTQPIGFGSVNEARLAERRVIMAEPVEFGSGEESPLDVIEPIFNENLTELLDGLGLELPGEGNSGPTPADVPSSTGNQQMDIGGADVSDSGSEDGCGDGELP